MDKQEKNPAAVELGNKRFNNLKASFKTAEELSEYMKRVRRGEKKLKQAKN